LYHLQHPLISDLLCAPDDNSRFN